MRNRLILLLLSFLLFYSFIEADEKGNHIQFLAGVVVLQASAMPHEKKAEEYRKLQEICGVTTEDVMVFLEMYRNHPEKWNAIQKEIRKILSEKDKE
jgi:hypothetical protein